MNKKIIAILVVIALATTSMFAVGVGVMNSNTAGGYAAISFASSRGGWYYGLGADGEGVDFSVEKNFLNGNFFKAGIFSMGYRLGAGLTLGFDCFDDFEFTFGGFGLAGINFGFDFGPVDMEFFGQWQPTIFMGVGNGGFHFYTSSLYGGYAGGIRFWF